MLSLGFDFGMGFDHEAEVLGFGISTGIGSLLA